MFSRLFKVPKSSLQLFREECAEMCQMPEGCRQLSAETFSSLPIIGKVGLKTIVLYQNESAAEMPRSHFAGCQAKGLGNRTARLLDLRLGGGRAGNLDRELLRELAVAVSCWHKWLTSDLRMRFSHQVIQDGLVQQKRDDTHIRNAGIVRPERFGPACDDQL